MPTLEKAVVHPAISPVSPKEEGVLAESVPGAARRAGSLVARQVVPTGRLGIFNCRTLRGRPTRLDDPLCL